MATIIQYPLTPSFIITVFKGMVNYGISKSGEVTLDGGKHLQSDFMNARIRFTDHFLVNDVNEENCKKILTGAGIEYESNPLDYIQNYLTDNGWTNKIELTRIIVPKPNKNLIGKKIPLEFYLVSPDFKHWGNYDLDVFMTPITRTSKSVKFSVNVPKYIYDKCMEDPDVSLRPKRSYIETDTIATLFKEMGDYNNQAINVYEIDKNAKNSTKLICINFLSSEATTRDDLNHAYTGQRIDTKFNYYIAYKMNNPGLTRYTMFTHKKLFSGVGSFDKGQKGIVENDKTRNYIMNNPSVMIEWTQEREDFLAKLENNFRKLSENLNLFLKDIDADKLEHLIANSGQIKFLGE